MQHEQASDYVCVVEHYEVRPDGEWFPTPCPGADPHATKRTRLLRTFVVWFLAAYGLLVLLDPLDKLP
jgi:hypothetical protein